MPAPRSHSRPPSRRGSAIVAALVAIVVLSAAAAAAFQMIGAERRALSDEAAANDAYALARSALDLFVADPDSVLTTFNAPNTVGPDSALYTFGTGHAWVLVERVRPSVSGSMAVYLIRSRAVRTAFRGANTPSAERIVAQYATWQTGSMQVLSAWTSLTGLRKNGGSGTISGVDACGVAPAVGGVAVPTNPGYTQNGGSSVPDGSPDIVDMGTQANANATIEIDWAGIVAGTALTPDIVIPGGSWPSFSNANYWPVIYVDQAGTYSLPGPGRGTLIVKNDLTISGSRQWEGIILVGGTLTSNGNNTVEGAVVTGLNVLLGQTVPASDVGNGNKTYRYDSCNVANAAARFGGLSPLRNATADNWPSY